jgi:hypothetical protein
MSDPRDDDDEEPAPVGAAAMVLCAVCLGVGELIVILSAPRVARRGCVFCKGLGLVSVFRRTPN